MPAHYRQTRFAGLSGRGTQSSTQAKGQKEELVAFAAAICGDSDWPIPLWQQLQAMRVAYQVEQQISPSNG